jgi:DNA repair exonuclease SbcCD ATPase subunit
MRRKKMPKKLTEDQMQRAVWAWLDWVSADSGSSDEPAAIYAGRKLVEEIEAGDKNVSGRVFTGGREVRLRSTIDRLRKERDDLKKELASSRCAYDAYSNICNQNLKPLEDHLGIKPADARRSGDIAERILQEIHTLKKDLEKSHKDRRHYQQKTFDLEAQVEGLLAERKEALFALGAVDAK